MKIAITGHTRGLGAEFKKVFENNGHEVVGFSRSNGYDLKNWALMHKMIDQLDEFDLFVSVAKQDFIQTTILYELWKRWRNQHKTIINISSSIATMPVCPKSLFDQPNMDLYRTAKVSLNEASAQLSFQCMWPKIITVNPLHLYSNPITQEEQVKLAAWTNIFVKILQEMRDNDFTLREITF
jgi:hypothetical protein